MKILVTGSSSHLASVLLPLLCEQENFSKIIGIDINKGNFTHPKFEEHLFDVRSIEIEKLFLDCHTVIHLAFVVLRSNLKAERKNRDLIRDINVNGSINVFQSAINNQVKKIIHISSAAVYGAWPDNPPLMPETQNRKIMHGFSYAEDKNAVEDWLEDIAPRTETDIICLRPHVILGPKSQPFLLTLLKQPFYPYLPNPQPFTQCVWEDDVADAIVKSIFTDTSGAFNLATEPAMPFKSMIQLTHKLCIPVPVNLLRFLHEKLWKLTSIGEEPGWLKGMSYSLAVDASKAKKELGWKPSLSTEECIKRLIK